MRDFWDCTFRELMNVIEGARALQLSQYRTSWEQTRWQAAALLQVHTKPGKTIRPTDLVKFEWDEKPKPKLTEEQEQRRKERAAKWDAEMKRKHNGE